MLPWDLVWKRVSKLPDWQKYRQEDFRYAGIGKQFSNLATTALSSQSVDFPVGSIVLGIGAGFSVSAAATAQIRGLDAVRVSMDYSGALGGIITGGRMNGAALWGPYGQRIFPGKELLIPKGDTITVGVENVSTSTISFDVVFHSMVPRTQQ